MVEQKISASAIKVPPRGIGQAKKQYFVLYDTVLLDCPLQRPVAKRNKHYRGVKVQAWQWPLADDSQTMGVCHPGPAPAVYVRHALIQRIETMTNSTNPQDVLEHLKHLEEVDTVQGAEYREEAQDVLADDTVSLKMRRAIADRLNQANHDLALHTVTTDESY